MRYYTLKELAEIVDGRVVRHPETKISGVAELAEAQGTDISFILSKAYLSRYPTSKAGAFIISNDIDIDDRPTIKVSNPYLAFARLLSFFFPPISKEGHAHKTAIIGRDVDIKGSADIGANVVIEDGCIIGNRVYIYAGCYIGAKVEIGDDSILFPNVTIYHDVRIGRDVRIHSGTVIGSDGFGYVKDEGGRHIKIPQIGTIIIEDEVEIGANVCIDRATIGKTIIKRGTKLDNLIQVAHNVVIGEDTVIAAQTGISGSCSIGDNVTIAGQVGIKDHITIADNTILGAQSGVANDLGPGAFIGTPAIDHNLWKRIQIALQRLPEILKQVNRIAKDKV